MEAMRLTFAPVGWKSHHKCIANEELGIFEAGGLLWLTSKAPSAV
jgi:hypothetical protein